MPKGQKNQERVGLRPIKINQSDAVSSVDFAAYQTDDNNSDAEHNKVRLDLGSSDDSVEPFEESSVDSDSVFEREPARRLDNEFEIATSTKALSALASSPEQQVNNPLANQPVVSPTKMAEQLRMTEKELSWLLKMDKLVLYNLLQILRGSSLNLYTVLYQASEGKGYCQFRQKDLMSQALINNPGTLLKQERWLQDLRLIEKIVQPGSHQGVIYYVYSLSSLPVPPEILKQFSDYVKKHTDRKSF